MEKSDARESISSTALSSEAHLRDVFQEFCGLKYKRRLKVILLSGTMGVLGSVAVFAGTSGLPVGTVTEKTNQAGPILAQVSDECLPWDIACLLQRPVGSISSGPATGSDERGQDGSDTGGGDTGGGDTGGGDTGGGDTGGGDTGGDTGGGDTGGGDTGGGDTGGGDTGGGDTGGDDTDGGGSDGGGSDGGGSDGGGSDGGGSDGGGSDGGGSDGGGSGGGGSGGDGSHASGGGAEGTTLLTAASEAIKDDLMSSIAQRAAEIDQRAALAKLRLGVAVAYAVPLASKLSEARAI